MQQRILTVKQERFLSEYQECMNINKACRLSEMQVGNVLRDLKKDTPFANEFKKIQKALEVDPRLTKIAGVEKLLRYQQMAEDEGDYMGAAKIQETINKMIEGNIAPTTQVEKKEIKNEIRVIDFTKKKQFLKLEQDNVQDAEVIE
jgi:GDP-D-mannose dehydratase